VTKKQAWASFWALGLIWGSSFLFIRVSVQQITPFQLVFIRTGIAAIGLTLIVYLRGKRFPRDWKSIRDIIFLGIVNTVLPFALISWSETRIESGLAAVLQGTAALFTLVIAHFAFADERINMRKLIGLGLGFLGVVILASRSLQEGAAVHSDLLGQLAMGAASFCYAIGGTYSRKAIQSRLEPIVVAAGAMTTAAIASGIIAYAAPLFGGQPPAALASLQRDVLLSALVLGFFNTMLAYTMFYSIVQALGAARTSMVTYIIPVVGLVLGWLFLSEQVDIRLVLGAILIIGGIGIVNLRINELLARISPSDESKRVEDAVG
jgi:drug/metabolite transporter (DMT)-like permease